MEDFLTFLKPLWENDFDRGYIVGCAVILLTILLFLIIRVVFALTFRVGRCKEIVVPATDGDILVSYNAISNAINAALRDFPAIKVNEVKLYRYRKIYFLKLVCSFDESLNSRFPKEVKEVKSRIFECLDETFGITSVKRIGIQLEHLSADPALSKRDSANLSTSSIEVNVEDDEDTEN